MFTRNRKPSLRVLLVECNNMNKWVGTTMPYEMHMPPLGLMYLAPALARRCPASNCALSSPRLPAPTTNDFSSILGEFRPDVVGIRSIAFFLEELQRIAALVRAHSDATLMAGGPIVKAYKAAALRGSAGTGDRRSRRRRTGLC